RLVGVRLRELPGERDELVRELAPWRCRSEQRGELGEMHQPVGVPRRPVVVGAVDDRVDRVMRLAHGTEDLAQLPDRLVAHALASVASPSTSSRWYGTLATTTPGSRSNSRLMYSPVWLCRTCSHQWATTNSGSTTVTMRPDSSVRRRTSARRGGPMSRNGASMSARGTAIRRVLQSS